MRMLLLAALAAGCKTTKGAEPLTPDGTEPTCAEGETYPEGAVEPMALGEVIPPYRWPIAHHRGSGVTTALDLAAAPCNLAPDIDWSPFDLLLFVSIPAW